MFLRKISCVVALMAVVYGGVPPSSITRRYVFENLKQLNQLIEKKKSAGAGLQLEILFDEYVDDARKLLESCDNQNTSDQQGMKKEDTVKQIAHYMAVLQKLLAIMSSNEPKPLESFCNYQRSDVLWGSLCGDRPVKRVFRQEIDPLVKKNDHDHENMQHAKIRYADSDEIQTNQGN